MDNYDSVKRAQVAGLVRHQVIGAVSGIEKEILDRLIGKYRSGTLTPELLYGGIGEISGLRQLVETLSREIDKGIEISEQMELDHGQDTDDQTLGEHPDDYSD